MRANRAYFAGRWAAQEARRAGQARADDSTYAAQHAPRWQAGSESVDTILAPSSKDLAAAVYPLVTLCREAGLPQPVAEYAFHPHRKWRADYAWPVQRVLLEIEGGIWTQGRHTRGAGYLADLEKYNAAALLGFHVLRYAPHQMAQAVTDLRVMLAR